MARPHETALIRRVIGAVREYENDPKGRLDRMVRRPHDAVVTDAVYATLAALGFRVLLDGSLSNPEPSPQQGVAFDHLKRTAKFYSPFFEQFCICESCQQLPEHETPTTGPDNGQAKDQEP